MLTRITNLLATPEQVPGVIPAILASTRLRAIDLQVTPGHTMIKRSEVGNSLSKPLMRRGKNAWSLSFSIDLAGGGPAAQPQWGNLLTACGWRETSTNAIWAAQTDSSGVTTAIAAGATLTGASSSATGVVLWAYPVASGATLIYLRNKSGTFTIGENLEVDSVTVAVAHGTTPEGQSGYLYTPESVTASRVAYSAIGTPTVGEIVVGGTSGVSGRYHGEDGTSIAYIEITRGTGNYFTAGETLTGVDSGQTITVDSPSQQWQNYSPTIAFQYEMDGERRRFTGCRGNAILNLVAGEPARIDFTFSGALATHTDNANTSVTHSTIAPLRFAAGYFDLDGIQYPVGQLSIDSGVSLAENADPNHAQGVREFVIADRVPSISCDPQRVLAGVHDFYGEWESDTTATLSWAMGNALGLRVGFHAPKVQTENIEDGDREGIATHGLNLMPTRDTDDGDDEMAIYVA